MLVLLCWHVRQTDADSLDRPGGDSSLDVLPQRVVRGIVELQRLLPIETEDGRRGVDALSVALAARQIDHDSHVAAPSCFFSSAATGSLRNRAASGATHPHRASRARLVE